MSKGNPDISMDIHTAILLILRGEKSVTQAVADIMRIPLEQVVDGCVYQFELERGCERCGGTGYTCSDKSCHHWKLGIDRVDYVCKEHCVSSTICACTDGKITKRISHYDLAHPLIALAYFGTVGAIEMNQFEINKIAGDVGTLRAIKIREVLK